MVFPMKDIVVLLPGITGSVLEKDGKGLWEVSGGAGLRMLFSRGRNLQNLALNGTDDPNLDDLGDGITATRLMGDIHLIPGLWKIDGYGNIRDTIVSRFDVSKGHNYFEFPYDWRRDNRVHARRLRRESHEWLKAWRLSSGNDDAKLILVAHSMGGLVARAFLELEEGWSDTQALFTIGTPFAGSLNAADFVVNGFKKDLGPLKLDLSDALRSMTSVYQLLPVYPSLAVGDGPLLRPSELSGVPHLDIERAAAAHAFHLSMNEAAERSVEAGRAKDRIFPIVGFAQPTLQSGRVIDGRLETSTRIDDLDPGGDGTVPRPSATPPERADRPSNNAVYAAQRHGSLQNVEGLLNHLVGSLAPRAPSERFRAFDHSLSLDCDDVFGSGEEVTINGSCTQPGVELRASIQNVATGETIEQLLFNDGGEWSSTVFPPQPEGDYRVRLSSPGVDASSVTDTFVTFDEETLAA